MSISTEIVLIHPPAKLYQYFNDSPPIEVQVLQLWFKNSVGIHTLSNVGIGTTNPTSKLTVSGDGRFTGVVTATTFIGDGSGLIGVVGSGSGVIIRDDGELVGTAGTINFGPNLAVSPIVAGVVTVTGSVAGIDTLGTSTFTNLNVTGVSTFVGITTVTGPTLFSKQLNISGISTLGVTTTTNLTAQQLNVSGVSTLGVTTTTNLTAQQLNVSGISTLGITTTTSLSATQLSVSGISTLGITTTTSLSATQLSISGVSTLGVTTATQLSVSGVSTLGITTTTSLSATQLSVSGVSTLGVTTATQLRVSGVSTLGITTTTSLSATQLSVSGVSTLGITTTTSLSATQLRVSGVVTATTFIGDGSGLIGVVGSGSGVIIRDDGELVGTAGTINFGPNLAVSPIVAGVVTVTGSVAGIDTLGTSTFTNLNVTGVTTVSLTGAANTASSTMSVGAGQSTTTMTLDSFSTSSSAKVVEYDLLFINGTNYQTEKVVLATQGTTAHSQESGIVYESGLIVSVGATVDAINNLYRLQATPEFGVVGVVTFKLSKSILM